MDITYFNIMSTWNSSELYFPIFLLTQRMEHSFVYLYLHFLSLVPVNPNCGIKNKTNIQNTNQISFIQKHLFQLYTSMLS